MSKTTRKKYQRCSGCKLLVSKSFQCEGPASCPNKQPRTRWGRRYDEDGMRGKPTLDTQEGNSGEAFGR